MSGAHVKFSVLENGRHLDKDSMSDKSFRTDGTCAIHEDDEPLAPSRSFLAALAFVSVVGLMLMVFFAVPGASSQSTSQQVAVDHPHIRYVGRFDATSPEIVSFSWSNSEIAVKFQGGWISFNLTASCAGERYLVLVNDKPYRMFSAYGPWKSYTLASRLPKSVTHTVRLVLLSEPILQVHRSAQTLT